MHGKTSKGTASNGFFLLTASLVFEQGTTSTRFMVFDQDARVVAVAQKEHRQI
jgi:hypothetical protein